MSADVARAGAEDRAERIRAGLAAIATTYQDISEAVAIAYHERDWGTLGYQSWDAYVDGEFAGQLPKLNRDERRQFVAELREAGLSTRAISSVAGVSQPTVVSDLAGDQNLSPAQSGEQSPPVRAEEGAPPAPPAAPETAPGHRPPTITGADGRHYPATRPAPQRPQPPTSPPLFADDHDEDDAVTGLIVDEADAQRDAELEAELDETAARFRRNFSAAVARADDLWQFDADRIAEVYAADFNQALRPFLAEMTAWCQRVEQTHRRNRAGLHVVAGGGR